MVIINTYRLWNVMDLMNIRERWKLACIDIFYSIEESYTEEFLFYFYM